MSFPTADNILALVERENLKGRAIVSWLMCEATLLSVREVARVLHVDPATVYDDCAEISRARLEPDFCDRTDRLREIAKDRPGVVNQATPEQIAKVTGLIPKSHRRKANPHG